MAVVIKVYALFLVLICLLLDDFFLELLILEMLQNVWEYVGRETSHLCSNIGFQNRNGKCQPEVTGTAEGRAVPPHRPTETNLNQNGYCHTSLKVLAHRHITQLGGNLPQGVGNVENSWKPSLEKKPSSFVHSKEGLAYHPDDPGRGAKRQDQPEVKPAAIGRHECVQKKLKQPKEELDMVGSSELRKRFVPLKGYKRLKRPHEEELGEQNGNYEDEEIEPERPNHDWEDLSRGCETIPIPVVNHSNSKSLPPKFFYISSSKVAEKAHVNFSLHRIVDSDCCSDCFKDCLTAPHPCACARYTGGEFAYTTGGCLRKPYIEKVHKICYTGAVHKSNFLMMFPAFNGTR